MQVDALKEKVIKSSVFGVCSVESVALLAVCLHFHHHVLASYTSTWRIVLIKITDKTGLMKINL